MSVEIKTALNLLRKELSEKEAERRQVRLERDKLEEKITEKDEEHEALVVAIEDLELAIKVLEQRQ